MSIIHCKLSLLISLDREVIIVEKIFFFFFEGLLFLKIYIYKNQPPLIFYSFRGSETPAECRGRAPRESGGATEGSQGQREAGGSLHPQSAGGDGGPLREAAYGPAASAAAAPHAAAAATAESGLSAEPHVVGEALHCFKGEGWGEVDANKGKGNTTSENFTLKSCVYAC